MNGRMKLSWSSISAGATAAAVSLGSSVQTFSASAAASMHALPTVVGGGVQAMSQGASAAASSLPAAMPNAVQAGAAGSAKLAADLAIVERPAKAIAAGMPQSTVLLRTASFLSKALPVVAIGASAMSGARIVHDHGPDALMNTKQGRSAVLGAMGGALLLVPHPATQLAAAGVLGITAANHFDGLKRFDA